MKKYRASIRLALLSFCPLLVGCHSYDYSGTELKAPLDPVEVTHPLDERFTLNFFSDGNLFGSVLSFFGSIIRPLAIISIAICGLVLITAPDPRSVEQAKSWLKYVVIGLLIFYLAPAIITTFYGFITELM